ncbi:hypothetical protein NC651_029716 [Populus alba x Populus x berolinensis]|nr:hypothetical protein NC651_029716 [Populus alba x Populus x berolinensis]
MLESEEERAMKMVLEDGIVKTKKIMEGNQEVNFTIEEYQSTMRSSPSISSDESQVDKAMNQDHPVIGLWNDAYINRF